MPIVTDTYTTTEDCSGTLTRMYIDSGQTVVYIGSHTTPDFAPTGGFLFSIPDSVSPGDITIAKLRLVAAVGGAWNAVTVTALHDDSANFSNTATLAPHPRAVAGNTAHGGVSWTGTCSTGATTESPDIAAVLNSALASSTPSGGFHRIGVYVMTHSASTATCRIAAIEHATYNEARLVITTGTQDATVTPLPVTVSTTVRAPVPWTALYSSSISYTNGTTLTSKDITDSGSRTMRIWRPQFGPAPGAGGHKVFAWFHGGFGSSGDMATIPMALVVEMLQRGYLVVSINYRLVELIADGFEFLASGNEASFPLAVHDGKVALRYLANDRSGANVWNADVNELIVSGFSYGGQIAQFLAYSKGDTNSYVGMSPTGWSGGIRPAHVGRTNNSTYTFDFTQNGESGINNYTVKGMFLWAGATDLGLGVDATATPNTDVRIAISNGRRVNVSRDVIIGSIITTVYEELDANKYLAPAGGTPTVNQPYLGTTRTVPNYPIGYARGTSDVLVTKAAGYDSLVTALTSIGYIATPPTTNVSNPTGLSYYEVPGVNHDGMESNPGGLAAFVSWMNAAFVAGTDATVLPSAVAATVTIPARSVTAIRNATVTPAAVARTVAVPARTIGAGTTRAVAAVGVTAAVTAPTVSSGASSAAPVVSGSISIPAPTVSTASGAVVNQGAVALTVAVPAPVVTAVANVSVSASAVARTVAIPVPTVSATRSATSTPSVINATVAIPTPVVSTSSNVTINAAVVTVTALATATSIAGSASITAPVVSRAVAVPDPTVGAGGSATYNATTVSVTATARSTSVTAGASITLTAVSVTGLARSATQTGAGSVSAGVVTTSVAVPTPTVQTAGSTSTTPGVVSATASIPTPTITTTATATPGPVTASVSALSATPSVDKNATPGVVAASAAVLAPSVVTGARHDAGAVGSTVSVPAPVVQTGGGIVVTVSTVTVTVNEPAPAPGSVTTSVAIETGGDNLPDLELEAVVGFSAVWSLYFDVALDGTWTAVVEDVGDVVGQFAVDWRFQTDGIVVLMLPRAVVDALDLGKSYVWKLIQTVSPEPPLLVARGSLTVQEA